MLAIHIMQLQKEVKSNPKQPSCKKRCAAPKKAIVKKDVKSKVAAKKWLCNGKNLNNNNSGEFGAKSYWNMEKATQILNCHY